ncbi:MAG: AraC family transcriptional regulator [Pseudomonadota bacterium]
MSLVDLIEGIMRGGAASLCIVMIVQIFAPRPVTWPAIYGALFFLGAAIYSVVALPTVVEAIGPWMIPFKTIGIASPAFFWLFVRALHDDNYQFRWIDAAAPLTLSLLFLSCVPFPAFKGVSMWINIALVTGLMVHTIYVVRCCMTNDLVTARRHVAKTMAWLIPIVSLAIVGVETVEVANMRLATEGGAPTSLRLATAVLLLAVAIVLTTSLSSLRKTLLPTGEETHPAAVGAAQIEGPLSAADRIDLGRIRDLMEDGGYLAPGLSIGELAQQLGLPEHRLRKLINGALGYRNFAAFVNDYRVSEAKRRLAQPDLVHTQITSLAFDLGYGSLAPFNRAFRERTGVSPSEFREQVFGSG